MPRQGGFQPLKRDQRKLAPGPQVQAANRGRAVGQQKVLAQAMKNQGPTARVAMPVKGTKLPPPNSGVLKQLLAQRDKKMAKKRTVRGMPRRKKSLIPPESAL